MEQPGVARWAEGVGGVGRSRSAVSEAKGAGLKPLGCQQLSRLTPGRRKREASGTASLEVSSVLGSPRKPTAAPAPERRAQDAARTDGHAAAAGVNGQSR